MSWESTNSKRNQSRNCGNGAAKGPGKIRKEYAGTEVGCHGVSPRMLLRKAWSRNRTMGTRGPGKLSYSAVIKGDVWGKCNKMQ